jgi:hypothetical protein
VASGPLTRLSVAQAGPDQRRADTVSSTFHRRLLGLLSGPAIIDGVTRIADSARGSRGLLLLGAVFFGAHAVHADSARSSSPTASGKLAASLAYSRCMRAHGVPGFPDPVQVAGGGIQISGSRSGLDPSSPSYESAQRSCGPLLPNGGRPAHDDQRRELTRMLHASQCMRGHGFAGFPDPTLSGPSNRSAYGTIVSNDGVWLAIPGSIDVRSPSFGRAAAACDLGLSS